VNDSDQPGAIPSPGSSPRGLSDPTGESNTTIVGLVLEAYRLSSLVNTVLRHLDVTEAKKYVSRLAFSSQNIHAILEGSGLKIVPLEGVAFDEGLAVSAVNLSDFDSDDELVIERVLEPLIMGPLGIMHTGIVSLKRRES
jgi:hypothetical protein